MWQAAVAVLAFIAGIAARSLIILMKDTVFYDRYLARRVADVCKRVLGPRIQIRPIGSKEFGFEHRRFYIMQVELTNRRKVPFHAFLDPKLLPKIEEIFNLFFCHLLENARVCTRFFNNNWEPLPEPGRSTSRFGLPPGVWVTLSPNGRIAVDVAGLSLWGDCYGAITQISNRWLMLGTGDQDLDVPLGIGEFYLEVSAVNDKLGITYAMSFFVLKYRGSIETFELSTIDSPSAPPSCVLLR